MTQQRGIVTDQLNNVIQVIQLGKKTGRLTVERGAGASSEHGELIFVNGQMTDAHINQWHGQQAWNQLKGWGTCRFIFTPTAIDRTTGPLPASATTYPLQENSPLRYDTPEHGLRVTRPLNAMSRARVPQRVRQTDEALYLLTNANLSRSHRNLFLLIDGNKTTFDLARLIGKSAEETQQFLRDLETLGIIQQ